MRKIIFLTFFTLSMSCFSPLFVHADDELVRPSKAKSSSESSKNNLVNLDQRQIENRIQELERQIDDIERDRRFQDERIRNLERTVNDLRRLRP